MTTLLHRRLTSTQVNQLIDQAPDELVTLTDDHRRSLATRFRAVALSHHRRLDAWAVERAGQVSDDFRWSPVTARRVLGNAALRRLREQPHASATDAVRDELVEHMLRATSGHARPGSLSSWLASAPHPVIGLVTCEAVNWTTQLLEIAQELSTPWQVALSDAYYDVASAQTTLRGRRDLVVQRAATRVVIRVRCGAPGKSAGPGLRADLTIDALTDNSGVAPVRVIGLWPEAGVCLAVDGTMDDLRAGARDLVRTAVAQRRHQIMIGA